MSVSQLGVVTLCLASEGTRLWVWGAGFLLLRENAVLPLSSWARGRAAGPSGGSDGHGQQRLRLAAPQVSLWAAALSGRSVKRGKKCTEYTKCTKPWALPGRGDAPVFGFDFWAAVPPSTGRWQPRGVPGVQRRFWSAGGSTEPRGRVQYCRLSPGGSSDPGLSQALSVCIFKPQSVCICTTKTK